MAGIRLNSVDKIYEDGFKAVDSFSLDIKDGEFVVLVGPSGCGKSTTLRMIAGLEDISNGEIFIGDTLVNNVPAKDRDIAMVFQSYALYPDKTVYKNIAFALERRKVAKKEIEKRVMSVAKTLHIEHLLSRKPRALSGGQRQRVALGRAIVRESAVFLLDEPLSNLDAKLRGEMRREIILLHKRLGTTFVYVTHDQTEAMTMGDRIVVMNSGVIMQQGTPQEVYNKPKNLFVATFIGSVQMNIIDGILRKDNKGFFVEVGNLKIYTDKDTEKLYENENKEVSLGIRAENIAIDPDGEFNGTVKLQENLGSESYVHFEFGSFLLCLKTAPQVILKDDIRFNIEKSAVHIFLKETGENICLQ